MGAHLDDPLQTSSLTKREIANYPGYTYDTPYPTPAPKRFSACPLNGSIKQILYESGNVRYEGATNKNNLPHGEGIMYHDDIDKLPEYQSTFREGRPHGDNIQFFHTRNDQYFLEYQGSMVSYERKGHGLQYNWLHHVIYEGQWEKNKYSGNGKQWYGNKVLRYEGSFSKGKYHGVGKSYAGNGTLDSEGQWVMGKLHGEHCKRYKNNW